jgi:hypothetical protein
MTQSMYAGLPETTGRAITHGTSYECSWLVRATIAGTRSVRVCRATRASARSATPTARQDNPRPGVHRRQARQGLPAIAVRHDHARHYGPVRRDDHTPINPATYDYVRAARDALHFGKLVDRWTQYLRRDGYQVQYFAVVEPQKRGAPHAHFAIRGTLPRALVKQLTAATYVSVWWPPADVPIYSETHFPEWHNGTYVDPDTRAPLPTWEEALDALGPCCSARLGNGRRRGRPARGPHDSCHSISPPVRCAPV